MDVNDGFHTAMPGAGIFGICIFANIGGLSSLRWVERCVKSGWTQLSDDKTDWAPTQNIDTGWTEISQPGLPTRYCKGGN